MWIHKFLSVIGSGFVPIFDLKALVIDSDD